MDMIQFKKRATSYLSLTVVAACLLPISAGAQEWHTVSFPLKETITGASFISADTGHLVTEGGKHARTFDGGENWWGRQVTDHIPLEDCYFTDAMTGFVCGRKGQIHYTLDGGNKWHDVSWGDTLATFVSIRLLDSGVVLASGFTTHNGAMDQGLLIRSTDRGATWQVIEIPGKAVGDFWYKPGHPIYCLSFGYINYSTDLGKTWHSVKREGQPGRTLAFAGSGGMMVGNHGFVSMTVDSGKTWNPVTLGQEQSHFTSIAMIDESTAYIAGTNATIFRTKDGGRTWNQEFFTETFHVLDLALAGDWLWAVGSDGTILKKKLG
jgi:photosystem II stability/assembly factor-like uncharacterized protein